MSRWDDSSKHRRDRQQRMRLCLDIGLYQAERQPSKQSLRDALAEAAANTAKIQPEENHASDH